MVYDGRVPNFTLATIANLGIQGVLGGFEPKSTELTVVLVKAREDIIIVEAADKVPRDRDLEVEAQVEVGSRVEEDIQVMGKEY